MEIVEIAEPKGAPAEFARKNPATIETFMSSFHSLLPARTHARWISLAGLQNATLLLRRVTAISALPESAPLTVTVLGCFELYVNGRRVGDHVLDPPVSNFSKRSFSVTHEIRNDLQRGRNCIAVWLAGAGTVATVWGPRIT